MAAIRFEEIQEKYLAEILAIYNHYVLHTTATFHAKALTLDQMREIVFFNSAKYRTHIIFNETEICGYVLITQHKKREAYDGTAEVTIYLKPNQQGRGLGNLALNHIETFAKEQNLHVLVATICGENQASIRLFEKNGYTRCAHYREVGEKFGQRLDIVAYQKIIS